MPRGESFLFGVLSEDGLLHVVRTNGDYVHRTDMASGGLRKGVKGAEISDRGLESNRAPPASPA